MRPLLSAAQSLSFDEFTRGAFDFPNEMLMEIASMRLWQTLKESVLAQTDLEVEGGRPSRDPQKISIAALCGNGDNAGDALAMLRHAKFEGCSRLTAYVPAVAGMKDAARKNLARAERCGIAIIPVEGMEPMALAKELAAHDIVLDAILGTGTRGPAKGNAALSIEALNGIRVHDSVLGDAVRTVSIDVPSGLSDDWKPEYPIVRADLTLCIDPMKQALFMPSARPFAGEILPVRGIFPLWEKGAISHVSLIETSDAEGFLPPISDWAHKMQRGRVAVLAGSAAGAGAALHCVRGALAAGAGYVALYCDEGLFPMYVQAVGDSAIIRVFSADSFSPDAWDAIVVGPGWGTEAGKEISLEMLLHSGTALILDADAIRMYARMASTRKIDIAAFSAPLILTPHPGEFADLLALAPLDDPSRGLDASATVRQVSSLAKYLNALIALRASTTHIASPDGECAVFDGSAYGLGVAGSGDVLSGLAGGLLARWIGVQRERNTFPEVHDSSSLAEMRKRAVLGAVLVHGIAGRRLSRSVGWFSPLDLSRECALLTSRGKSDFWSEANERI